MSKLQLATEAEQTALNEIRRKICDAEVSLAQLRDSQSRLLPRVLVKCEKCGGGHPIGTLTFVQTHWYVSPHGCTGGDYWNAGEGNWYCPSCGYCNRIFRDSKDPVVWGKSHSADAELFSLSCYFKAHRDCYCEYSHTCDSCRKLNQSGKTRGCTS